MTFPCNIGTHLSSTPHLFCPLCKAMLSIMRYRGLIKQVQEMFNIFGIRVCLDCIFCFDRSKYFLIVNNVCFDTTFVDVDWAFLI
jgi:hypothetical protein